MISSYADNIKQNCDISDAKYWGYFSICGLLMRYRDLYRSERGLKPWAEIERDNIAEWIREKEARWPELEKKDFQDISIRGGSFKPFDVPEINAALNADKLVYGAGYGMYMKPAFFLAELASVREMNDHTVYISGRELARDLFTAPAMLQGRCIFLRREPLTALLYEKFSEMRDRRKPALEEAFSQSGITANQKIDADFENKLANMVHEYSNVLLRHELAESMEDAPEWRDALFSAADRNAEYFLRAVKDLIADTSDHGPLKMLIENRNRGGLGLFIALMDGYRRILYPRIREAYDTFVKDADWGLIDEARRAGHEHFKLLRETILKLYKTGKDKTEFNAALETLRRQAQDVFLIS